MKKKVFLTIAALFLLLGSVNSGLATTIDNYTLNFESASTLLTGANVTNLENIKSLGFTNAKTVVGFFDNDASGDISQGDTFDDYFAIAIDSFKDKDGNSLFSSDYGETHQITILGHLKGTQTEDNEFAITSVERLEIYFDAGNDYTVSDTRDLDTYADGILVETGSLILGGGTNEGAVISGTFDLIVNLEDILHTYSDTQGEFFELDRNGNPFPMELVFGIVDSNTDATQGASIDAFANYFDFDPDDYSFIQTAENDGTINKALIPEPSTVLLLGFGLIGMAGIGRRKFFNK